LFDGPNRIIMIVQVLFERSSYKLLSVVLGI